MFLHMATSAKSREKSGAAINPGLPLTQGDLLHSALRLPSIAHILFLLGTRQKQDVQIKKQSASWYGWREKTLNYWTFIFTYLQKELTVHSWKGLFRSTIFLSNQLQRVCLSMLSVYMSCLYVTDVLISCSWDQDKRSSANNINESPELLHFQTSIKRSNSYHNKVTLI